MSRQRVDLKEAAEILDISTEGVRKRIKRGTLESEKDPDGKVYVWLPIDRTEGSTELIEALREQVKFLSEELEDWKQIVSSRDEELKRKDHLLAAALERIPAIEPPVDVPPDEPESSVTASEEEGKGQAAPEPETAESQPWWRRIFK